MMSSIFDIYSKKNSLVSKKAGKRHSCLRVPLHICRRSGSKETEGLPGQKQVAEGRGGHDDSFHEGCIAYAEHTQKDLSGMDKEITKELCKSLE